MSIRDTLNDISRYILPEMGSLKITGTDTGTKIQATNDDAANINIFLEATLTKPIPSFEGVFGIGNVPFLRDLLNTPLYKSDRATIEVKRHKIENAVESLEFRDANGQKTLFRCMSAANVPPQPSITSIPWDITMQPTGDRYAEFTQLAAIFSRATGDKLFGFKTENEQLLAVFGSDHATTHSGTMVLQEGVTETIKSQALWSHVDLIRIVKLAGGQNVTLKIAQKGVLGIEIAAPVGLFKYYLKAQSRS